MSEEEVIPTVDRKDYVKGILTSFYSVHQPDKMNSIDVIMDKYKGSEDLLLVHLKEKYGSSFDEYVPTSVTPGINQTNTKVNTQTTATSTINTAAISSSISDISSNLAKGLFTWGSNIGEISNTSGNTNITNVTTPTKSSNNDIKVIGVPSTILSGNNNNSLSTTIDTQLSNEEIIKKLNYQIDQLRNENNKLTSTIEITQRNYSILLEKESGAQATIKKLDEQLKVQEKHNQTIEQQLETIQQHNNNKHKQLLQTISLNHRLGAQIRHLVHSELENYSPDKEEISLKNDISDSTLSDYITDTDDIGATKNKLATILALYIGNRSELKQIIAKNSELNNRIIELQQSNDSLQSKLDTILNDLEQASGSADTLRKQMNATTAELNSCKLLLGIANNKLNDKEQEVRGCLEEITLLNDSIKAAEQARIDLISLCSDQIKSSEASAYDSIKHLTESVLLEREDYLSKLINALNMEKDLKILVDKEQAAEVSRLRDELFKSRRSDAQKYHEISYLQQQLTEAAQKISILENSKGVDLSCLSHENDV